MTHVIAVVKSSMTAYPEVDALRMGRSSLTLAFTGFQAGFPRRPGSNLNGNPASDIF